MPKLILTTEAQGKVAYEFAERSITIGRAPDNMIVIDDPSVSNRHAQLELSGETYRLKDLDSTNGTKVNGVPITETALRFEEDRKSTRLNSSHANISYAVFCL